MIHEQTKKYAWSAEPYEHYERSRDWYWILGITIVTISIIAIITKNYLFAFLIILGGILIVFSIRKKPNDTTTEISTQGIKINGYMYRYEQIESFWLYRNLQEKPHLLIHTDRVIFPKIIIPLLPDMDFVELHTFLIERISEKEQYESTLERIADRLGL